MVRGLGSAVALALAVALAAPAAAQVPSSEAVVLVSGFSSSNPFTTPAPSASVRKGGPGRSASGRR